MPELQTNQGTYCKQQAINESETSKFSLTV